MSDYEVEQPLETQEVAKDEQKKPYFFNFAANALRDIPFAMPPRLYHYTSSAGMIGIAKHHKVWFSDARFLNDGPELNYGITLACETLKLLSKKYDEITDEFIDEIYEALKEVSDYYVPVVFCLSKEDNLLNQWRDYGKDVVPYCIEFETEKLLNSTEHTFPTFLCNIEYEIPKQIEMMTGLLEAIYVEAKKIDEAEKIEGEKRREVMYRACEEVFWFSSRFKNGAFSAEQEWRIVSFYPELRKHGTPRLFRSGSLGVTPYYEWGMKDGSPLPITHVTVGPSPYAQVSDLALKQLLEDNKYTTNTSFSTIPIRR